MTTGQDSLASMFQFSEQFQKNGLEALRVLKELGELPVGASEKTCVYREDKINLYRYAPIARPARLPPLLICYAMINRPYVLDLQPDRSLIRELLGFGIDVYLLDWGYPDGADRFTGLEDYVLGYLHRCVDHILKAHDAESLNLLGVCQGGALGLCYAALEPRRIANMITMVTPVDFKTPENLLSKWVQLVDIDLMTQSGNVSGELLNVAYLALMPFRLTQQKYVDLANMQGDRAKLENFARMEKWIFDSPDQPARAFGEFVKWMFQENRLIKGLLDLKGRRVLLNAVTQPVLNIFASRDHLVPPSASIALGAHVGSADYTQLAIDVGHIGMYVSSRARNSVSESISKWLLERVKHNDVRAGQTPA
jgi:polyhydroxyalkanoate synthase subunit PhaC